MSDLFYFKSFELHFESELILPGYIPIKPQRVDVIIKYRPISPLGINAPTNKGLFFQVNATELWLHVPNIARFLIREGREIFIDSAALIPTEVLSTFLSGPCMAALLMQRELLVLKGCVMQFEEQAIAYIGEGCSGKSTMAAALLSYGYKLMSDDLCIITTKGKVLPGASYLELYDNEIKKLKSKALDSQIVKPSLKKYRLFMSQQFYNKPLYLTKIYVLNPCKKKELRSKILSGSEKINYLQKNIYNKLYLAGQQKNSSYFRYIAQLAQRIRMTLVEFNGVTFDIQELSNYVNECL